MVRVTCVKKKSCADKIKYRLVWLLRTAGNYSGCHQMPERSFFYKGKQFPVCARCTGVSVGQLLAVIGNAAFIIRQHKNAGRSVSLADRAFGSHAPVLSAVLLFCMGADWLLQETGIRESTNRRRFITGILGGFGLFHLYFAIAKKGLITFARKI